MRDRLSASYGLAQVEFHTRTNRGAVMILTFLIIFVLASAWDITHANRALENMVNPGRNQSHHK